MKRILLQVLVLTKTNTYLKYRGTILGYAWALINPLLMMFTLAFVFSTIFNMPLKNFVIFLFSAMVPWNHFANTIMNSSSCMIANEGLIKKINLPIIVNPLSISLSVFIDTVFTFIALSIIMIFFGAKLSLSLLIIPFSLILVCLFSFGIGVIFSILTVYFRDTQHLLTIVLQALFFLSPILYDKTNMIGPLKYLIYLNPIVPFIDLFRNPYLRVNFLHQLQFFYQLFIQFVPFVKFIIFNRFKRDIIFKL